MRTRQIVLTLGLSFAGALNAAEAPDAGATLRDLREPVLAPPKPAPALDMPAEKKAPTPADGKFVLKQLKITGAKRFTEAELLALVRPALDKEITLMDLSRYAEAITLHYRQAGYVLSRAYLPAQEVSNGRVEIAVIEAQFGKVDVQNRSRLSDSVATAPLKPLGTGEHVEMSKLERGVLLLSDTPGVEVKSTLTPGATPGAADLIVRVEDARRVSGNLELDNYGSRFTGDVRAGGGINLSNGTGLGDVLRLRALTSGSGMQYGRLSWQLPVGSEGIKVGAAYTETRYSLGKDFKNLDAKGDAKLASVFGSYPILRSRNSNLAVQLSYDDKDLQDRIETTGTVTDKSLGITTLSLLGDTRDDWLGGGFTSASASVSFGDLSIDSAAARALDAATAQTDGRFSKLALNAWRLQRLGDQWSLSAMLSGQWADKNLDSSEKFSLGGAQGVRAYPQGEAPGDTGWMLNADLRYNLSWAGMPADVQLVGFLDHGRVKLNRNLWAGAAANNHRALSGAGVGVNISRSADFSIKFNIAWKVGNELPTADNDEGSRAWLQAVKYF